MMTLAELLGPHANQIGIGLPDSMTQSTLINVMFITTTMSSIATTRSTTTATTTLKTSLPFTTKLPTSVLKLSTTPAKAKSLPTSSSRAPDPLNPFPTERSLAIGYWSALSLLLVSMASLFGLGVSYLRTIKEPESPPVVSPSFIPNRAFLRKSPYLLNG